MRNYLKFYIDGNWVDPVTARSIDVINPATEASAGRISVGSAEDVDRAVKAARAAFPRFSQTSVGERMALLERIIAEYKKRYADMAAAITEEMGAPVALAKDAQAAIGLAHLQTALSVLGKYSFQEQRATTLLVKEPIGVCGFITPWNWPINQIACKVTPALAVGCTMVLKPSEIAPFSAQVWTEIMHAAGVPAGVFNLVNGDGPTVGAAIASHPDIDMVSFTGSTRAGIEVARNAAQTVKRVHQELGGKSPNIILADADFKSAVTAGVRGVMGNSGQSCNAPTRMLVPNSRMAEAIAIAKAAAEATTVGDPASGAHIGPVISATQWDRIQRLINKGIEEGATVVAGGPGKPVGLETGYYVKPTVLANVNNRMTVAREEIFGPVLSILGYDTVDEAVAIGNDTPYGLAAYVSGTDPEATRKVAARLRAGQVNINSAAMDLMAPFGGFKQSGNGREWGDHAFGEFLEVKAVLGFAAQAA
ncbi:aldehyde dehydrogenase family protein [Verminephrobacter eiseniae]|uniref:aldehyde dehydrogenase family protein n=1 Tax=Verminephrobacter eiseniae TaxID=364317 RepID=UPI0010D8ACD0|nr:aldehyde dehydrogenase family protein [Verminephrobacter eiseniae]KAB7578947.1 aldehyde dehydrogenase family protein [Verminephrobacter sp. Larva24]MCW5231371.1 aldehyde dehydrogenase family protein [Verminephrobacter eiseniae]MCW5293103.1 aldehyde dehydrogenase family protein [Verminephrobacter eiseniae]MCW8187417.1 aldehyde dehydrogenase family protein [Verminephrobacter eiseniae]MCW8225748.1 aldehyde dehydrogenase family protein [Verminephrobacter eiseniae]